MRIFCVSYISGYYNQKPDKKKSQWEVHLGHSSRVQFTMVTMGKSGWVEHDMAGHVAYWLVLCQLDMS